MREAGCGGSESFELVNATEDFANVEVGETVEWLPNRVADFRIGYDEAIHGLTGLTFGNLRLPRTARPENGYPVALIIHGGGWTSSQSCDPMEPFAEALTDGGIATWNLEYRRPGNIGGGWPGTFLDVGRGIDCVRRLAPVHGLDLERVVVTGHSAGAHLALWAAGRHGIPEGSDLYIPDPLPVCGVVALDAWGTDLRFDIENKAHSASEDIVDFSGNVLFELLGAETEAQALTRIDGPDRPSPVGCLPLGVSVELIAGTADLIPGKMPSLAEDNLRFARAASVSGDEVKLTLLDGACHFDHIDPSGPAWKYVFAAICEKLGMDVTESGLYPTWRHRTSGAFCMRDAWDPHGSRHE